MARSMLSTVVKVQRDMNRAQAARTRAHNAAVAQAERAHAAAVREAERARKAYERAQIADQRERARLYAESRAAAVAADNEALTRRLAQLSSVLADGLAIDPFIDVMSLKRPPVLPVWAHQDLERAQPAPNPSQFAVPEPTGMSKLFGQKAHQARVLEANAAYEQACHEHQQREGARLHALGRARREFDAARAAAVSAADAQHAQIDALARDLESAKLDAILTSFELAFTASELPDEFPIEHRLAYVPASRQLVLEIELPGVDVIPEAKAYRYVKSRDEVTTSARPATQIRTLYNSMIAQLTLRRLHEMFGADRGAFADTIVVNAMRASIDPRTGQPVRPCLITVRTTREAFEQLDLANVDPSACLKHLSASVSRSPAELEPVRPVLEFSMVDERFVDNADLLSQLDSRPNLMELTPTEFETLITNLFTKMGLDTRQTRPSRDGGVDCVAFDQRAILGGKVVIQAKRYRNTVGVSAVRDLYGTVMNEGASKGILVTTSGYGRGSVDFANGKPLELLDGANLLSLLAEHAGIEAKIIPPEDWRDPRPDSADIADHVVLADLASAPPASATEQGRAISAPAQDTEPTLAPPRPAPTKRTPAPAPHREAVIRTPLDRPSPGRHAMPEQQSEESQSPLASAANDQRLRCGNFACAHHGEPLQGRQCPYCFHYAHS